MEVKCGQPDGLSKRKAPYSISLNVSSARCPMESLDLSANQLSIIEAELLADAVNSLRDVTLVDTGLSLNQV